MIRVLPRTRILIISESSINFYKKDNILSFLIYVINSCYFEILKHNLYNECNNINININISYIY